MTDKTTDEWGIALPPRKAAGTPRIYDRAALPGLTSQPAHPAPGLQPVPPTQPVGTPPAPWQPADRTRSAPPGPTPTQPRIPPINRPAPRDSARPAFPLGAPGTAPRQQPSQAPSQRPPNPWQQPGVAPAIVPMAPARPAARVGQNPPPRRPPPSPQPARGRPLGCWAVSLGLLLGAALALLAIGGALIGYASIAAALPSPDELQARASQFNSTLIYDRQGELLNEVADPNYGRRTAVSLDAISPYLKGATIATEDPNFYEHPGVDPVGIARAVYHAVKYRDLESTPGGSTITQQLVKLTFLSPERSLTRKLKEAVLAAEITRRYPKDKVLEIYLNEIYYGNLAYGIEAAAETYFDKRASELTLAEAALLAGLPQAPAYYDPYTRLWNTDPQGATASAAPGAVKRRQSAVLSLMVQHGAITPAQADAAWQEPIKLKPLRQTYTSRYPHFTQYARSHVEQTLGPELLAKGGLRIYTTLDPRIQGIAEDEVAKQVKALASQGASNGALVAIQPKTGEILALVGSADFYDEKISGQIDMALVPRQPGSAIKPFTYLAAFEMPAAVSPDPKAAKSPQISAIEPPGYWTPSTAVMDIRTEFPDGAKPPYVPVNYDEREHGLVTVRSAIANSYNIPAVKTLEHVGLDRLKEIAKRVGITTLTRSDYGLSLTLGGGEVTLLELTAAYAVLANSGVRAPASPIACVLDTDGKLIWRGNGAETVAACQAAPQGTARPVTPAPPQPALNAQHVYLMTSILSDLEARRPMFGTSAEQLSLTDRPAAAKTGTTNDYRDGWTVGYTPELAVGVWVGNADYKPMQKVAGSIGAAPIWHNVMQRSLQGQPSQPFVQPAGIQRIRVCADTGTLPGEACPAQREEVFAADQGPLPAQYDLHQRVRIDKMTGRLATDFTPPDRIEERNLMLFPPKYRAWAEAHDNPQPAIELPAYAFPPELQLIAPINGAHVQGIIGIMGHVRLPEPLQWRVEYGVGPNPIGWGTVAGPVSGDRDGQLAEWDTARPVEAHGVQDFSLRLAAYDSAIPDYPVAASNAIYVTVANPTATPAPSPSATASPSWTATRTPTLQATPTTSRTPTGTPEVVIPPTTTPTPLVLPTGTQSSNPTASPAASPATVAPATATPAAPEATATATVASAPAAIRAAIAQPLPSSRLSGRIEIIGSADGTGFTAYQLEFAMVAGPQPPQDNWQPVGMPQLVPVTGGVLGMWETRGLKPGAYWLRLAVYDTQNAAMTTQVPVEVTGQ